MKMINKIKPWIWLVSGILGVINTIYVIYSYYTTGNIYKIDIYAPNLLLILAFINMILSGALTLLKRCLPEEKVESKTIYVSADSTIEELLESKSILETTTAALEYLIKLKQDDNS